MATQRQLVLDILIEVTEKKAFYSTVTRQVLEKYDYLDFQSKAFIRRLSAGTLERMTELDYLINQYSSTPVDKMKPVIRNVLRMSCYQILYMDSVPDSAACNEAVKLVQKRGLSGLKGFVNAVLRKLAANKEHLNYPDADKDKELYLSIAYSIPLWLVKHFLSQYSEKNAADIMKGLLEKRPVVVRLSQTTEEDKNKLLKRLEMDGVKVTPCVYPPYAYHLDHIGEALTEGHGTFKGVSALYGFQEGLFTVQDVGSMLSASLAGIKPGNHILDICAAPGGKTFHAAQLLHGKGQVIARDLTVEKTNLIRENKERLKPDVNIVIEEADASVFDASLVNSADVVIADLPCSGLGVIGRKPDIKYRVQEEDLKKLAELQKQILTNCAQYVKEGGILMYSTCTLNTDENEGNADWLVRNFPFEVVSFEEELPESMRDRGGALGRLTLLPGLDDSEGFFVAKMRKIRKV